ncbi:luc7-like protein 3 isoform X2 [Haliotis rubra]|uniref:luc7-like protein 3 isoform X2 n=1 Tax=Haliotis rubra TaxID=36100 RepID=UPI001EE5BF36|nr:luc7-like protein 3 isoform X2 [Haliotis rubra]
MMAAGAAAALLDELMGRDRNLAPSEQRSETHWSDPEVCKYFLCGFCPHELFVNTRADLGPCDKIHDDLLRKEYVKSSRFERMGYEDDFMRFLQGLISDVEKRIRRGHMRLALNSTQGSLNGNLPSQKEEKITMLTEKINELVNQAEQLGCEGKVEEAQGVMKLCDQLREERRQLENNETGAYYTDPEKTLEVCGCCSALLVVGDAQQRIDEHLMGKQHMGYARIRAFLEEHKQKKIQADVDEREAKEAKLAQEREEREKEREKEREDRRKKEKEKEDEKKREREKEREKRRKRSRSRSRRSRSRDRRSRSRDRRRSSSRDRKRRSRSRSRHRTGLEVETVISLAGTGQDQEVEVAGQEAEIEDQGVEDADHVAGIEGHVAEEKVDGHEVEIDVLAVETRAQGNAQEAETKTGRRVKRRITTGGSPQRKTRRKWGRR